MPGIVAEEVAYLRARIADGAIYVVKGDPNLVHSHTCPTLYRLIDRERAWNEQLSLHLSTFRHTMGGPFSDGVKMPVMLTRLEVESLPRYEVCQTCSPDTDTRHKRRAQDEYTEMRAQALGRDHLGRTLLDDSFTPLGPLDSVEVRHSANASVVTITAGEYRAELDGDAHVRLRRRTWAARTAS